MVGGGPAGLAAALAARQAGLEVTVADCAEPPIDKACGEGIMPDGVAALAKLGVQLDVSQGARFAGIRFINGSQQVDANFHRGPGLGLRRTLLHDAMVSAANHAGVQLLWNRRVTGISHDQVLLDNETVNCRWVIAADGQNSRMRRLAGLGHTVAEKVRFGFRQHYRVTPWSEFVEVYWGDCGQMYVTPVAAGLVCVAFITSHRMLRFEEAIGHFPELASRLTNAVPDESPRGAVTGALRLRHVQRGNVALMGEAAGTVDAITGEGLAIAFQQATALAGALTAGDLSLYEAAHRRIMRLPRAMAALLLSLDGRPRFCGRVFAAFEAQPAIFERMLAIHTGAVSPVNFGLGKTLSLGWHLLTAQI